MVKNWDKKLNESSWSSKIIPDLEDEDLAGEYGFVKAHEARRRIQTEKRQLPCAVWKEVHFGNHVLADGSGQCDTQWM